MCGPSAPKTANVDPEKERLAAEAEATAKANQSILSGARRKRGQQGLLSSDAAASSSVLASAPASNTAKAPVKGVRKTLGE